MMRWLGLTFLCLYSFSALARTATPEAGVWRFELRYPNVSVPFLMEFEPGKKGWSAVLINGKERIALDEIRAAKETWIVPLQTYQNHLELKLQNKNRMTGHFVKTGKLPIEKIPLVGEFGGFRRFDRGAKPTINLNGQWAMSLTNPKGETTQAIALFDQVGSTVTASIITPTGDYRYIDGVVIGNEFKTAAFDGVFNFVFTGKLDGDTLTGKMLSKTTSTFTARKDANARLPDPFKQTQVEKLEFKFPDTTGKEYSLAQFANQPVIIQIFGSWCPNCMDELQFLAPWYRANRDKGIQVIALSFERAPTPEEARKHLAMVVKKRDIPYPVLLAATSPDETPAQKLPAIKNFISFPTTIFLNRKHQVVKVHAGFNGPGTGVHYQEFVRAFNATVEEILK